MKKPTILFIILVALVAFAYYFNQHKSSLLSGSRAGVKSRELVLPDLDAKLNDVRKIHIQDKEKSVHLVVENGVWKVAERGDYPAAVDKIHRVLASLSELKVGGKEVLAKAALGDVKLLPVSEATSGQGGLSVELFDEKGGVISSFVAGDNVKSSGGANSNSFMNNNEQRFIRVLQDDPSGSDNYTVWVVGESLVDLQPGPEDWIDKGFVDVRKIKTATITTPNAADSWKSSRADEKAEFKLDDAKPGEELDTAKASGLNYVLSAASFTDVLPKDKVTPDLMKGAIKVSIDTFEDFHYHVELAPKKDAGKSGAAETTYYLKLKVSADIPKERKAVAGEKDEDKKANDEKFAAEKKQLEDKLAKEKTLEGWVYEVSSGLVTALTKKRSEILKDKTAEKPAAVPSASQPSPHGTTVTTPPISLPPHLSLPLPPAAPAKPEESKGATPPEPKAETKPATDAKPVEPKTETKPAEEKPAAPKGDAKPAEPKAETAPVPAAETKPEVKPEPKP